MALYQWQTPITKLASNLGALGFPLKTRINKDERTGRVLTEFDVGETSLWRKGLNRGLLLEGWQKGTLAEGDPLHPFLCGLSVEHNYEMLLDAQKRGRHIRLVGVDHRTTEQRKQSAEAYVPSLAEYRDGEELPAMTLAADGVIQIADLSLAAALGTVGIPVIRIDGAGRDHRYTLPRFGHWLRGSQGIAIRYDASQLAVRTGNGLELALEISEPSHPVVSAYNVRAVHIQLVKHLREEVVLLTLRPPGTRRMAIITETATNRVLDAVQKHFQI